MAGPTLPTVNKRIRETVGKTEAEIELVRGAGYFYFVGDAVRPGGSETVPVFRLSELTVEQWIDEARVALKAYADELADRES